MIVGLISDTHGLVRTEIARIFEGASLIVHAGDVGADVVLETLGRIAPVEAVFGNVDDPQHPSLTRERRLRIGGVSIHVSHGHELGRPTAELMLATYAGDVVMFGHTHRATVVRQGHRIAVNPGAAGPRRFDVQPSVARLVIGGARSEIEIISLA